MKSIRSFLALVVTVSLALLPIAPAYSAVSVTDEHVEGQNRWSIQRDGDQVPGADSTYDIGESGNEVANLYVDNVRILTTVFATGYEAGASTMASEASNLTSAALTFGIFTKTDLDSTSDYYTYLADGVPKQTVTITLLAKTGSGNWVITDDYDASVTTTKTNWDDITFNSALDSVTLLFLDNTVGWVIVANDGCTISNS